jgi:hypothetical protein
MSNAVKAAAMVMAISFGCAVPDGGTDVQPPAA